LKKINDIEITDFNRDNYIVFGNIEIFSDTPVYNSLMKFHIKNDFLECQSETYTFHSSELYSFFSKCKTIYEKLSEHALIKSVEENKCIIEVSALDNGYIEFSGTIEQLMNTNKCVFKIQLDQTCLKDKFSAF